MLDSQKIFFESIDTFHDTLTGYPTLLNQNPTETDLHNRRALFISCGFTISIFNSLETFLKKRFEEASSNLGSILSVISLSDFDDGFKKIYTEDALVGISKYLSTKHHGHTLKDKIAKIENFTKLTHDFFFLSQAPSAYGFGYKGSNILYDDIERVMIAFGIPIKETLFFQEVCKVFGGTTPTYKEMYDEVSKTRHKAAHNWYEQIINQVDVEKSLDYTKRMGFLFDITISFVISQMKRSKSTLKDFKVRFDNIQNILEINFIAGKTNKPLLEKVKFVFLDVSGNGWKYGSRKISNKEIFIQKWLQKKPCKKMLLIRNNRQEVLNWYHNF